MTISSPTQEELTEPRTQAQLREYVDTLRQRFDETESLRNSWRLSHGAIERFKNELYSLSLFADAFYSGRPDVWFYLLPPNATYDAEAREGSIVHTLEITQGLTREETGYFSGYQDRLRREHLNKFGRAPATCAEIRRDADSGEVLETWPEFKPIDELLKQSLDAIRQAVVRKSAKQYPTKTSLIVEFRDDYIQSSRDRECLDRFARTILVPLAAQFETLYLVSDRQRLAFMY